MRVIRWELTEETVILDKSVHKEHPKQYALRCVQRLAKIFTWSEYILQIYPPSILGKVAKPLHHVFNSSRNTWICMRAKNRCKTHLSIHLAVVCFSWFLDGNFAMAPVMFQQLYMILVLCSVRPTSRASMRYWLASLKTSTGNCFKQ